MSAEQTAADAAKQPAKLWVYIGTYTAGTKSKGIYRCELDLKTGQLSGLELAGEAINPSFLAIHPGRRHLYAVGEAPQFDKSKTGAVSAFAIAPGAGKLTALNQQPSRGTGPCHIVCDAAGRNVLVANYGGGSAAVLPTGADGRLGEPSGFRQHKGSSVNPQRQEAPHAHSINLDPAGKFAFVADLGLDEVVVYKFDAALGAITPNEPPAAKVAAGAGPRHFAFHPSGQHAYVINELNSTVTVFGYDAAKGTLTTIQTITSLPPGHEGVNYPAEIVAHPSGRFVYGSNRGHDSLAIYQVEPDGTLKATGHQGRGIKNPRNFNIDPTGAYLLCGSQDADTVLVFKIDPETGALEPSGEALSVPKPVCLRMMTPLE